MSGCFCFLNPNLDNCKNPLCELPTGGTFGSRESPLNLPALNNTSSCFITKSALPRPNMALSPGSGNTPLWIAWFVKVPSWFFNGFGADNWVPVPVNLFPPT